MPYYFKPGESIELELRRIRREELESAVSQLGTAGADGRDQAIHEARKSIKKTRGLLRLLAPRLGRAYTLQNARLRSISLSLSPLRDGGAMLETFRKLMYGFEGDPARRTFETIRAALVSLKEESERAAGIDAVLERAARRLERLTGREKRLTLHAEGFAAIAPGLRATFGRGRKALKAARKSGRSEDFHTWRKRAKDHWYHVRLIEPLWDEDLKAYEAGLKELETSLGDDHNLTVLEAKITTDPFRFGSASEVRAFLSLIERSRDELRRRSLELGAAYDPKPRQFSSRIEQLWNRYQANPEPIAAAQAGWPPPLRRSNSQAVSTIFSNSA